MYIPVFWCVWCIYDFDDAYCILMYMMYLWCIWCIYDACYDLWCVLWSIWCVFIFMIYDAFYDPLWSIWCIYLYSHIISIITMCLQQVSFIHILGEIRFITHSAQESHAIGGVCLHMRSQYVFQFERFAALHHRAFEWTSWIVWFEMSH